MQKDALFQYFGDCGRTKSMKNKIKFKKFSGNGNDFILLDRPDFPITSPLIQSLCDRHFGIGGDGVLILTSHPGHDARMQIFNADGGEAEMCGNGIRCLVTYLDELNEHTKDVYKIKTMNGVYEVTRRDGAFAIEMSEIKDEKLYDLSSFNEFNKVYFVNTGVPHLVFLVNDLKRIDIKSRAPQYRFHKLFPNGTNVSFVQIVDGHQTAFVRTYERGVEDETYSCGTGLTACGIALNTWNGWQGDITLKTLGGTQKVSVGDKIYYSGEVKFCFEGEFIL
jgi:diaminopimelate epimerase